MWVSCGILVGQTRGSFLWVKLVDHYRGSNSCVILVSQTRASFSWVILVIQTRGSFSWVKLVGHSRGSNSWVILVGRSRGSFLWVKLVDHSRGSNSWVILVGHSRGSFSWVKLVSHSGVSNSWVILAHSLPLVILVPQTPGTLRSQNCPKLSVRLWILITFSENWNIYNLLYGFLFFLHSTIFLFPPRILEFYPP